MAMVHRRQASLSDTVAPQSLKSARTGADRNPACRAAPGLDTGGASSYFACGKPKIWQLQSRPQGKPLLTLVHCQNCQNCQDCQDCQNSGGRLLLPGRSEPSAW